MKFRYLSLILAVFSTLIWGCIAQDFADVEQVELVDASETLDTGSDVSDATQAEDADPDTGPCNGQCSGNTPLCNTAVGECVACLSEADCAGEEVCSATGQCVECTDGTHCDSEICSDQNVCVSCIDNAHCIDPTASVCEDNECVPCTNNDGCEQFGATPICDDSGESGVCVGCVGDGDCTDPAAPICDPQTNLCVECVKKSECPNGVCDQSANVCVQCLDDPNCADPSAPVCDTTNNTCMPCQDNGDCSSFSSTSVCDTSDGDGVCVECFDNSHCSDPAASVCGPNNTCVPCSDNTGCDNLTGTSVCDTDGGSGVCVECTVSNESPCNGNSCDPATNTCTNTPVGTIGACQECKADSECVADHRCVPMEFDNAPLNRAYCLKIKNTSQNYGCSEPYSSEVTRRSRSGAASTTYCSILESKTTCAAVQDLIDNVDCAMNDDCGIPGVDDALCQQVGSLTDRKCTYECSIGNQCPADVSCGTGTLGHTSYCGG